jgi:NAD(P)H-hydrate repair Nnr-like enzyme with NAD(P)H-hydrate dehydratase domain
LYVPYVGEERVQIIDRIPKLKPRAVDAHKGDFGKVCIIAGSIGEKAAHRAKTILH